MEVLKNNNRFDIVLIGDSSGNVSTIASDNSQYLTLATAPQVVAVGSESLQSSAVNSSTKKIVISATTDCWIAIGNNPTANKATAGNIFLGSGSTTYPISVTGGQTKVAVIQDSLPGYISIIESN